ncbi:MAG: family phage prohead protease [Capsulimonas sp.]|nr:family phage prohead protease [Capsulimonas sp.]
MTTKIERKSFELKAATLEENQIRGAASVTGVMDRGGDVIFPGAWKPCIKSFLANGFVAVGHAWDELPVAMPLEAKEVGNELQTLAEFHSTPEAQAARTVCKERMAKNLAVGLSVGFMIDYDSDQPAYMYFESGKKLLAYAEANGYDMSLFDVKGIKAADYFCRAILKIEELIEYSIVPVPCNQHAGLTEAKSILDAEPIDISKIATERDFDRFLRDAGFSRKHATAIALHGFKNLQRDADETEETPPADDPAPVAATKASELTQRTLALRMDSLRAALPASI